MAAPTYTYTSATPNATDPMNVTAPLIQANFQAINELISVNHVPFNTANTSGNHNQLSMQFQTDDPGTAVTDLAVYVKATGSPNAAEIFYQYPNNGTVHQLTPSNAAGGGGTSATTSGTGWCQFPSGIIMRWGVATINAAVSNGVIFTLPTGTGIPVYQQSIGYVQATLLQSTSSNTNFNNIVTSNAYGLTKIGIFTTNASPSTYMVNYLTIGL